MRKTYHAFAFTIILPILAACGGGGSAIMPVRESMITPLSESRAHINEAQSSMRQQPYKSSTSDLLYVANTGNDSITVYRHDVSGNTAPMHVIAGAKTGLNNLGQLSEDAHGNLYVATRTSILVFAHGASGNIAPIRNLVGPAPGLKNIGAMTVDQTTGKIFVTQDSQVGEGCCSTLSRYPPDASGNQAPFATGNISFWARQLDSDSTGFNLLDAHTFSCCKVEYAGVETYVKQFAPNTNPTLVNSVGSYYAFGLADDASTKTFLISGGYIDRYGNPQPGVYRLKESDDSVVSVITSATCAGHLSLGYLRNIYTTCQNAIYVYTHDSSGNVPPLRVLSGPATDLNKPYGIYAGR